MFTSQSQLRSNPKLNFNDKSLPTGSFTEREQNPVLDCDCNPKGSGAYKTFFDMQSEKNFVPGTLCVQVTPAQKKLLDLITPVEAEDFSRSLHTVHFNGTYSIPVDMIDPVASMYTHMLLDAITAISVEKSNNNLKSQQ